MIAATLCYNDGIMESKVDIEKWRAAYRARTEAMQRVHDEELRALTDADVLRILKSLNVVGTPWRERPDWSGLVEQQAIFHRRRKP